MEAPATNREILTKGAHDPMLKNMLNFMSKKYVKYTNRIKYVYVYIYINMLATLEQIFLPHKSEGIGIGTGTTLFGSFALNLSLLSPMSIELEPSH